jgi:hypothetical protein
MEKPNVCADGHATTGLANNLHPAKLIPMIPSSQIALRIADTDITSHYTTYLRKAATRSTMLQRCLKHYGWSTTQFGMIDWKAHHGTLQKLQFANKKFVTKFMHQCLPITPRAQRCWRHTGQSWPRQPIEEKARRSPAGEKARRSPAGEKARRSPAGLALWLERNQAIVTQSKKDATKAIRRTQT